MMFDRACTLLDDLVQIIRSASDSEAVYRALVAVGTLISIGEEPKMAADEVYGIRGAMKEAEGRMKEPRMKSVVAEIGSLLSL
jgi:phospholipase A-2-activating protein